MSCFIHRILKVWCTLAVLPLGSASGAGTQSIVWSGTGVSETPEYVEQGKSHKIFIADDGSLFYQVNVQNSAGKMQTLSIEPPLSVVEQIYRRRQQQTGPVLTDGRKKFLGNARYKKLFDSDAFDDSYYLEIINGIEAIEAGPDGKRKISTSAGGRLTALDQITIAGKQTPFYRSIHPNPFRSLMNRNTIPGDSRGSPERLADLQEMEWWKNRLKKAPQVMLPSAQPETAHGKVRTNRPVAESTPVPKADQASNYPKWISEIPNSAGGVRKRWKQVVQKFPYPAEREILEDDLPAEYNALRNRLSHLMVDLNRYNASPVPDHVLEQAWEDTQIASDQMNRFWAKWIAQHGGIGALPREQQQRHDLDLSDFEEGTIGSRFYKRAVGLIAEKAKAFRREHPPEPLIKSENGRIKIATLPRFDLDVEEIDQMQCDATREIIRNSKEDPALLAETVTRIKSLQKKYPRVMKCLAQDASISALLVKATAFNFSASASHWMKGILAK